MGGVRGLELGLGMQMWVGLTCILMRHYLRVNLTMEFSEDDTG